MPNTNECGTEERQQKCNINLNPSLSFDISDSIRYFNLFRGLFLSFAADPAQKSDRMNHINVCKQNVSSLNTWDSCDSPIKCY